MSPVWREMHALALPHVATRWGYSGLPPSLTRPVGAAGNPLGLLHRLITALYYRFPLPPTLTAVCVLQGMMTIATCCEEVFPIPENIRRVTVIP